MQRGYLHAQVWTTPVVACHSRLTFVVLLCREPGKRLKQDVPDLVVEFESSQDRKKKMSRTRAGEGVCVCVCVCVPHVLACIRARRPQEARTP
jgi:hypothetical protein